MFSLLVLASVLAVGSAHVTELGSCKTVTPQANFNAKNFEGLWYIIEIYSATSDCMTMTFNLTSDDSFKVTKMREWYIGNMLNIDHTYTNTGYFTSTGTPGKYKSDWSTMFDGEVTIHKTDYTKYSVVIECVSVFGFIRRVSVIILSRTNTLDSEIIQEIKTDLETMGYSSSHFDVIDHSNCNAPGEADFNFGIDDGNFNFNGESFPLTPGEGADENPGEDLPAEVIPADLLPGENEILGARRRRR